MCDVLWTKCVTFIADSILATLPIVTGNTGYFWLEKTSQSDWEASFALIGMSTDYNFRLSVALATGK